MAPERQRQLLTLITGAAGFIGYHSARALLARGDVVLGIDNLNDYYSVELKRARLRDLTSFPEFTFVEADIADEVALHAALSARSIDRVLHLAAQAGVRYSVQNPQAYVRANLVGHANVLEACRGLGCLEHLVYASSSSVYGRGADLPFSEADPADRPASLYAATKRADELMSHAYAELFDLPQTGLRFFTVYGPWGRPDMAVWTFTKAVLEGRQIQLFNEGRTERDFTFIDDVVAAILAVLDRPPMRGLGQPLSVPHRIYNVGSGRPASVAELVATIETATGLQASTVPAPLQAGDLAATAADVSAFNNDFGFRPSTPIDVGVPRFVDWYRSRRGGQAQRSLATAAE